MNLTKIDVLLTKIVLKIHPSLFLIIFAARIASVFLYEKNDVILLYLRGHRPRYARPPRKYSRIMQHMFQNARIVFENTASPHEYATHSLLP